MEFTPSNQKTKRVKEYTCIQNKVDTYEGCALIGIEYTVELIESNGREPQYFCVLCDRFIRNPWLHWPSFNHRLKYLERHYPTVVRKYRPDNFSGRPWKDAKLVTQIMAEAIDNFHGRLPVKSMTGHEYNTQKKKHIDDVVNGFHYDERFGPNFLDVVKETLAKQRDDVNKPDDTLANDPEALMQTLDLSQERNKWLVYGRLLKERLDRMEALQRDYDKSPENHPLYSEEWDMFWVRRFKQLKEQNLADPKTYDYKPEWVIYWTKRMKELYDAAVETAKKEIRLRLGLPEEDPKMIDQQPYEPQAPSFHHVDDHALPIIHEPVCPPPPRARSRSRSPLVRDLRPHSGTRSRSRSLTRFVGDRGLAPRNYLQARARDGYNSIDNGRGDYDRHVSLRHIESADDYAVASTSKFSPTHARGNRLDRQAPEQRFIDSYRESKATAPPGQRKNAAYNSGRIREEDLLDSGRTAFTRAQGIISNNMDGMNATVAGNDRQIRSLAVVDRNVPDGGIAEVNWKKVDRPLTRALVDVLRRNHGPEAQFRDAGWYQGRIKLIAFKDERSPILYKEALRSLGEVWRGARLDLLELSDVPNHPRAFVLLPVEPSRPSEILELIQQSNTDLPTRNWKVTKVSLIKNGVRNVTITVNGKSIPLLEESNWMIRYGSQRVKLRLYHEDAMTA